MKLKMADNSLFAILLRSSWWVSAAVGLGVGAFAVWITPAAYAPFAAFAAMPFVVIAAMAGWRQMHTPSDTRVDDALNALRAMSWVEFSNVIERQLVADGGTVERIAHAGADFSVSKDGRRTLVSCKRWKVARAGINFLRELEVATQMSEANGAIYIAAGDVTDQARKFALQSNIRLLERSALVQWLRPLKQTR
ncbi:MAG TPA: restriction endonuclease [Casimicrobiaceae bacterium]|nr:restriction endonuclease [Casimicrobiaceae bacterium]